MRAILVALVGTGCVPEEGTGEAPIDDGGTVEDPSSPPPEACSGPAAQAFFGDHSSDVLTSGVELTLVEGEQQGFHIELGLTVESPEQAVAWLIEAVDVQSGELVAATGGGIVTYTALPQWTTETCTGFLAAKEVRIGDGDGPEVVDVCGLDGRTVRAEAYVTAVDQGDQLLGEPQATLEILVNVGC